MSTSDAASIYGPFKVGKRYRVLKNFTALRDSFTEGDVLTFTSSAYSRYDGITGYFFSRERDNGIQWWDVSDEVNDKAAAKEFFEEIPEG